MIESSDASRDVMEVGMEGGMAGILRSDSLHCFFFLPEICNSLAGDIKHETKEGEGTANSVSRILSPR